MAKGGRSPDAEEIEVLGMRSAEDRLPIIREIGRGDWRAV
jgi:hypothetical protein